LFRGLIHKYIYIHLYICIYIYLGKRNRCCYFYAICVEEMFIYNNIMYICQRVKLIYSLFIAYMHKLFLFLSFTLIFKNNDDDNNNYNTISPYAFNNNGFFLLYLSCNLYLLFTFNCIEFRKYMLTYKTKSLKEIEISNKSFKRKEKRKSEKEEKS
jgi:hypothetical protein